MKTAMSKGWIVMVVVAAAILAAVAAVYSGVYNVAADSPHWRLTTWLMQTVRERSVEARAHDIDVPKLDEPLLVSRGARDYEQMCVGCHLAPGVRESALRQGLYPRPPELSHEMDPRSTFWIIKHGIKMTGMPAWGSSHDDKAIWSLVAFVNHLPKMNAQQYRDLVAQAGADGHSGAADAAGHQDKEPASGESGSGHHK